MLAVPKLHFAIPYFPATGDPVSPLPTKRDCLHTQQDHVVGVFPRSCSRVDLGYHVKSKAMLLEHIQGLPHVFMELFATLGGGDN